MTSKKLHITFLLILFAVGFLLRLYRFNNPVADWHSWRQADTSAVSWNFIHHGFDILHPRYFDISNVQSGFDNPDGYRYVEFPLYNIAQAGLYKIVPVLTLEEWGRLVSIVMFLLGSLFLFLLVQRRVNRIVAFFVLIFALFFPYNIYYSRTILPDTSMVATMLGSMYFLDRWLDQFRNKEKTSFKYFLYIVVSLLFLASSFLLKGYTLFYGLAFFALVFSVLEWKIFLKWELWILAFFSVLPFALWRKYMLSYPQGIPVNAWLFNGNGIRFRPAFFRWIVYERLIKLIGGYINSLFMVLGLVGMWQTKKERLFFFSFILCAAVYMCVIATGNVQHDYYQIVITPAVAIVAGFGAWWLVSILQRFVGIKISYAIVSILMLGGFWLSWMQVKDYFNINNIALVHAGEAVEKLTPTDAKVIAPYDGDTTFLYYTKRKGWPSFEHDLPTLIKMGADYLVLVNPKPADSNIGKDYTIIARSQEYILFDLHQKP